MALDLDDAYTSLDWADRQAEVVTREVKRFIASKPYSVSYQHQFQSPHRKIFLKITEPAPRLLGPAIASVLQAQRAALDYLAVSLAKKNGATKLTDVYFPITSTEEALADKRTLNKIGKLSKEDAASIRALKPYDGGHKTLFTLHWLNKETKHRRLNVIGQAVSRFGIGGQGYLRHFRTHGAAYGLNVSTHIATLDADAGINLEIEVDVMFAEIGNRSEVPVIRFLIESGISCREILDLFRAQ